MIWSVSTSGRSSTATRPVTVRRRLHADTAASCADVDEVAVQRGRGRHLRADEVRARRRGPVGPRSSGSRSMRSARPGRECPGSCRGTSSSRRGATRSRRRGRSGRALPPRPGGAPAPSRERRAPSRASRRVRPSTIAAAARRSSIREFVHEPMKTRSIADLLDRLAGPQAHVLERALGGGTVVGVVERGRVGHDAGDRHDHARIRAPRHLRDEVGDVDDDVRVVRRAGIASRSERQSLDGAVPVRALRARARGPRGRRRSSRRARSCPRARPTRSTCCRSSSAAPSRGADRLAGVLDDVARRRRRRRPARSRRGSCPSL